MQLKKAFAALTVTLIASGVQAQSITPWKTVGDWTISVDAGTGDGCFMEKIFDDNVMLKFGILPRREAGYIAVYRKEWTDIEYGKITSIKLAFDGIEHDGRAVGDISKPWYGGYSETKDPQVVYEFAKKYNMTVNRPRNDEFTISLDGTLNAMRELEACQAAQS